MPLVRAVLRHPAMVRTAWQMAGARRGGIPANVGDESAMVLRAPDKELSKVAILGGRVRADSVRA
eukprot:951781-Lingulodinium_polyedra.AAC.1